MVGLRHDHCIKETARDHDRDPRRADCLARGPRSLHRHVRRRVRERPAHAVDVPRRRSVLHVLPTGDPPLRRKRLRSGTAFRTDDFAGGACWLAPGESVDEEALGGVLEAGIESARLGVIFEFMEQVGASHPDGDHWHLPGIGVDPCRQGAGIGSLLLAHTPADVDRNDAVAYLESSNPLNVALYERFGFEVIAEIQAGDSPTIWPMLRPANPST